MFTVPVFQFRSAPRLRIGVGIVIALLSGLLVLASSPAFAGWTTATAIPSYSAGANKLQIAIGPDRSLAVVWYDAASNVWVATRAGANGAWVKTQLGLAFAQDPRVAMNAAGDITVVWVGSNRISVRYRPAGGAWEATSLLELGNPNIADAARISMNAAGNVLVTWIGLDNPITRYEIHAAFRSKAGPWPSTGSFEVPGGPANQWGELASALDDAGHGVATWPTVYATVDDGFGLHTASVLLSSKRSVGGSWSAVADLTPRGQEGTIDTCDEGLPGPFPDATSPVLAIDPASEDLALAYNYNPVGIKMQDFSGELHCLASAEDSGVRLAVGTTVNLPVTGALYGTWVGSLKPALALVGGTVAMAWGRCEPVDILACEQRMQAGVATLGDPISVAVDTITRPTSGGSAIFLHVAAGDGKGYPLHVNALDNIARVWEVQPGQVANAPIPLLTSAGAASIVANDAGEVAAAIGGTDGKVYITERLDLIFDNSFE